MNDTFHLHACTHADYLTYCNIQYMYVLISRAVVHADMHACVRVQANSSAEVSDITTIAR